MRREFGMFVALILMCGALWASNVDFLGLSNASGTSRHIAMLGIYAIGIGFVIVTGGIDLSVGSVIGLTGILIAKFSSPEPGCFGWPMWIGISLAVAVALVIGLCQGLLITRLGLQPFIVTLGGMLLLRGVSQTIAHGGTLSITNAGFPRLANGGLWLVNGDPVIPYTVILMVVVALLAAYLLHFTVFGRYVYAIGGNRDAAEYSGINVKRVETLTYVISAGMGAVAGVCYASYIKQMSHDVGGAYELTAIAAAVLGGCSLRGGEGTVVGILIGSAIMKVIDNGIIMFQIRYRDGSGLLQTWKPDDNWRFIIIGAVILIAVILDQLVHVLQARKRIRSAGEIVPPSDPDPMDRQRGFEVLPAGGIAASDARRS